MDLKSKGIRWVESVRQTFETVYEEVDSTMSQVPTKYVGNQVNTVGKGVKEFCSSVFLDLLDEKPRKNDASEASAEESDYIDSRNVEEVVFYMNGEQQDEVHGAPSGLNQGAVNDVQPYTQVKGKEYDPFFDYEHIESPWIDSDRSSQMESAKGEVMSPLSKKSPSVTNVDKLQKTSYDKFCMHGGTAKELSHGNVSYLSSSSLVETQESNDNGSDAFQSIFESRLHAVTTQDVLSRAKNSYHRPVSQSTSSLKVEKYHSNEEDHIQTPWYDSNRSSQLESAQGDYTLSTNISEVAIPNSTKPSSVAILDKQHKSPYNDFYMNGGPVGVPHAVSVLNQGTLNYAHSSTPVDWKKAHIDETDAFCNMFDSGMYAANKKDALSQLKIPCHSAISKSTSLRADKPHSGIYPEYEYIKTPWGYSDISSQLESAKGELMLSIATSDVAIPNNTKRPCVTILEKRHKISNNEFSIDGEQKVNLQGAASELNHENGNYVQSSPSVERQVLNINMADVFYKIDDSGIHAVTHDGLSQLKISYQPAITDSKSSLHVEKPHSDPYHGNENIETPWGNSDRSFPLESAKGEFRMFNNMYEVAIPNSTKPPSMTLLDNPTDIITSRPVDMSEQNENLHRSNSSECFIISSDNYDVDYFRVGESETLSYSSGSLVEQGWDSSTLESSVAFSDICISDDFNDSDPSAESFYADDIKLIQPELYINRHPHFPSSHRGRTLKSYKKLIQDTLNSKKRLIKEYKQLGIWHGDIYEEQASVKTTTSTISSSQPAKQSVSSEVTLNTLKNQNLSDWELL